MPTHEPPQHTCIVCNCTTLPNPRSVGFAFIAYKAPAPGKPLGDGICSEHGAQDLRAHQGNGLAYRSLLEREGFTVHDRNFERLLRPLPPPGATCTKKVYPAGAYGSFHGHVCGNKAKMMTNGEVSEPRCGMHDPARLAAKQAERRAEYQAKVNAVDERRAKARTEASLYADMLLLLKESKGRASPDGAWNDARDAILARAADLEA